MMRIMSGGSLNEKGCPCLAYKLMTVIFEAIWTITDLLDVISTKLTGSCDRINIASTVFITSYDVPLISSGAMDQNKIQE